MNELELIKRYDNCMIKIGELLPNAKFAVDKDSIMLAFPEQDNMLKFTSLDVMEGYLMALNDVSLGIIKLEKETKDE